MISVGNYSFSNQDARNTFGNLGALMSPLLEGACADAVLPAAGRLAHYFADELGVDIAGLDPQAALDEVSEQARQRFGLPGWGPNDAPRHLGALMRGISEAMQATRAAGGFTASVTGEVASLHTSLGGVPKLPRESIDVSYQGVRGDVQSARQHHGRPWQALCIWSGEVIDELREQGHNMVPGHAGENITVRDLPWSEVRPGTTLRCGPVVAEVWAYAEPCSKLRRWFTDGDFSRLNRRNGDYSRVYALVRATGRISLGDAITLEPR